MTSSVLRRPLCPPMDCVGTIVRSTWLTPTIKAIWIRLDQPTFTFLPGQSLWPKFHRDGRSFSKIYSIASSPSHCPEVELCVSRVGWSSAHLQDLAPGLQVTARGPYGLMTLETLPQQPRLYVAEGSGIAPLKSQIDWLYESGFDYPVWLIQANPETPDQLPYLDHWRSLCQRWPQFHYYPVLDAAPERILPHLPCPLAEVDVDLCGVGDRVEHLYSTLVMAGANPQRVRSEKFYGF